MKNKTLNQLSNGQNKYAVIKIDETEYWQDDVAKAAGKIYGVYLVDLTKPTHCCSLSVSFPAENIKNFFPNPPADLPEDTLFEYEQLGDYLRQDIMYIDGNSKLSIEHIYKSGTFEDAIENESANPTVC